MSLIFFIAEDNANFQIALVSQVTSSKRSLIMYFIWVKIN